MARIALTWEIGGSLGHATSIARLALRLRERGHHVGLFLRSLATLRYLPETQGMEVYQAPRWLAEGAGQHRPAGVVDILRGVGYLDPDTFAGLLGAWRSLLSRWKPDLVLADFAPTSLLAARTLGIRRATFGNGFFAPPRLTPIPPFRVDSPVDEARLRATEAEVLASVNGALERWRLPPLRNLAELLEADEDFLCTFPELDHYGTRPVSGYWGPRISMDGGRAVDWPPGPGKRVFIYVQRDLEWLDELLEALRQRPHSVVAFIPGLDAARAKAFQGPRRRVCEGFVRLERLYPQCDLLVSHGGEIAGGTLAHGIPLLTFPTQYEQFLTTVRIAQLGAGLTPSIPRVPGQVAGLIDRLLGEPSFAACARAFARRYPTWSPAEQRRRIIHRIEALVAA